MITPCRHDRETAAAQHIAAEDTAAEDTAHADHATAEPDILDDGKPPF